MTLFGLDSKVNFIDWCSTIYRNLGNLSTSYLTGQAFPGFLKILSVPLAFLEESSPAKVIGRGHWRMDPKAGHITTIVY